MARSLTSIVTLSDLNYMVSNEGLKSKTSIPSSNECVTRSDLELYTHADEFYFSSYSSNQLIPYGKIVQKIYLEPFTKTVGNTAGSFTFDVLDPVEDSSWTLSDNMSWLTLSPTSGISSPTTVTATYSINEAPAPRNGTITVTSGTGATNTLVVTQQANPGVDVDPIILRFSVVEGSVCSATTLTRYLPTGETFTGASWLYSDSGGYYTAPQGFYSEGSIYRYWSGTVWSDGSICF